MTSDLYSQVGDLDFNINAKKQADKAHDKLYYSSPAAMATPGIGGCYSELSTMTPGYKIDAAFWSLT